MRPTRQMRRSALWRTFAAASLACAVALSVQAIHCSRCDAAPVAEPGVVIVLETQARGAGWSTAPVEVTLLPSGPGQVYYRWGAGPGGWVRAHGPLVAPEGKQLLSAVLVDSEGQAGEVASTVVRSDFTSSPRRLGIRVPGVTSMTPAALSSAGSVTARVQVRASGGATVRRLGGRDRYDVAVLASQSGFSSAQTVLLASGEKFPDALTASGLAGALDAPLLLTLRTSLPPQIAAEIARLGATRVIVCGGPMSVDPAVVADLQRRGLAVERITGGDRFAVAANVAARIRAITGHAGRALIARGDIYPDALSLGPLAFVSRDPVLLVLPNRMPAATAEALAAGYDSAAIAGGPVSVSPQVESEIRALTGSTVRWGGADRYEAAVTISSAGVTGGTNSWAFIAVAKGTGFADALTGGVASGKQRGTLLLTEPGPLSAATDTAMQAHVGETRAVDVLGGPVSVWPTTYEQIRSIFQ